MRRARIDYGVAGRRRWLRGSERDPRRVAELPIRGAHNVANALAACALAGALGVPLAALARAARASRACRTALELVATRARRRVATTIPRAPTSAPRSPRCAACRKQAVLILGGEGKGQDFAPLRRAGARARACRCC